MTQEILTLIIVISAASYAIYLVVNQIIFLFRRKSQKLICTGCTGCALHTVKHSSESGTSNMQHI